jgi:hypothetical protein
MSTSAQPLLESDGRLMANSPFDRRAFLAAAGATAAAAVCRPARTEPVWSPQPEVRLTAEVLPPELISGTGFNVGREVTTNDFLNLYTVTSDYGTFAVQSDAMLRRLEREIAAIRGLAEIQQTDAFKNAAEASGKGVYESGKKLVEDPAAALSAFSGAASGIFNRGREQLRRSGQSRYEDNGVASVLAVSSYKRDLCKQFGVDPYSTNPVLQKELDRVAWASAAGNLLLGALSMATGSMALQVASNVRLVGQAQDLVLATPPAELSIRARATLTGMNISTPVVDAFLSNHDLSPRHVAIIVASLESLGRIPGQEDFLAQANQVDSEIDALLTQQIAELLAGYHASTEPLESIRMIGALPLAVTKSGRAVMLLPVDRILWTPRTADLAKRIAAAAGGGGLDLWVTGDTAPVAASPLADLGFRVTDRCGKTVRLLD